MKIFDKKASLRKEKLLFFSCLVLVLAVAFYLLNSPQSLTGRFILDDESLYINANYSLPKVTIGGLEYLVFNITPDQFVLNLTNASSQVIKVKVNVSWPAGVQGVVYSNVYLYNPILNRWDGYPLSGNYILDGDGLRTNWINMTGSRIITINASAYKLFEGINFLISYACKKEGENWDCGCYNQTDEFFSEVRVCDNWMMQLFNVTNIIGASDSNNSCVINPCSAGYYCNSVTDECVFNSSYVAPSNVVYLNECGYIGSSNTLYTLNKTLSCSEDNCYNCFFIDGDNITLEGNGFSTDVLVLGNYPGVNRNKLIIRNLSLSGLDSTDSFNELVFENVFVPTLSFSGEIYKIIGNKLTTDSTLSASIINLTNSWVQNLNANGIESSPNGGTISLVNSSASSISVIGVDPDGNGGVVKLVNSVLSGHIYANGGFGPYSSGGNGGSIELINSVINDIYSNGGETYSYVAGSGGNIIISNSEVNLIQANGASGGDYVPGAGGRITIAGLNSRIKSYVQANGASGGGADPDALVPNGGIIRFILPCPLNINLQIGNLSCESGNGFPAGNCTKSCPSIY